MEPEPDLTTEEWEAAWAAEINRRIEELDSGQTKAVPWETVIAKLRESLRRWRAERDAQ
ncbi:MAG TPA: addiction module protein [Tepidisphaeraceae bacterium]|nr:addiction module protein [Tepidisphaeraceae bacterium]